MDNRNVQELLYSQKKNFLYGQEQKVKVLPRFELGLPE